MNPTIVKKHSKSGVASCLIALGVWFYFGVVILCVFYSERFWKILDNIFSKSDGTSGLGELGLAIIFLIFLLVVVPFIGHLIGLILGAIGTIQSTKNRLFGVIGLILNIFPFVAGLILYLIGDYPAK